MSNLYHVLYHKPALEHEDMYIELEELARKLVRSGLLRIDTDGKLNFARFSDPANRINRMFSKRELHDRNLIKRTYREIAKEIFKIYPQDELHSEIKKIMISLRAQLNKFVPISEEIEIKIARILVQACHPILMKLILLEKVEVFFSYSQNIGDMLDVVSWQQNGQNSGMQSTDGKNVAIFVSAGGDPLKIKKANPAPQSSNNNKDEKPEVKGPILLELEPEEYGDGQPALARAIIIAAQEIGHYGDLMRTGRLKEYYSRHSAEFMPFAAKPKTRQGRLDDIKNLNSEYVKLQKLGLERLLAFEEECKFYIKNRVKSFRLNVYLVLSFLYKEYFCLKVRLSSNFPIGQFYKKRFTAIALKAMFDDMAFNLEPKADVYKNKNKVVEEAIACIEALARVPQQERKWGEKIISLLTPNLYSIFYLELIPQDIKDYERFTGQKFTIDPNNLKKLDVFSRYKMKISKLLIKFYSILSSKFLNKS